MKLHRMEITAFGPFAGHESIDFDTLNDAGVFLLNGETGSGKTSVLDAICFALYGSGPTTAAKGGRKAQHSDHADPRTGPRVDVEFTAGGRRWQVSRTPAWREPSARAASGWADRHATVLLREYVDGEWVDRGYRPDDVGQTIHHAVGLDREQFTQVMMLPQGQFARFLQAGSREREDLLETLFGTDVFADVQDELKARADKARTDLRAAETDVHRSDEALERFRERVDRGLARLAGDGPPDDAAGEGEAREKTGATPAVASAEGGAAEKARHAAAPPTTGTSPGSSPTEGENTPGPGSRADVLEQWKQLRTDARELVRRVADARDRAAASHAEAQTRVSHLESMQSLVTRLTTLSSRREELDQDSGRVRATEQRLREHTAAYGLQHLLGAARRAGERVGTLEAAVSELRGALTEESENGRTGRQALGPQRELLDALSGAGALPDGLHEAAVAARESARGVVDRERALEQDRAEARRERERVVELEARAHRLHEDLLAARRELTDAERAREELVAGTKDEALVRERARACRETVTVSREYEKARAVEAECAADYERDEATRREAAHRVEDLEARRFAHAATTLAGDLTPGEPCPVCGSTVHPRPAVTDAAAEVTSAVLDSARAAREAAQGAVDHSHTAWREAQRAAAAALARGADPDLEAVLERAEAARHAEEELEEGLDRLRASEREITAARERVTAKEEESARLGTGAAAAGSRAEALQQRCDRAGDELSRQLRGFPTAADFLERAENLVRTVSELGSVQRELDEARVEARATREALHRALDDSPFQDAQQATAALLGEAEATELAAWVESVHDERAALQAELATRDMRRAAGLAPEERLECTAEAVERAARASAERETRRDDLTRELGGLQALEADIAAAAQQVPAREDAHRLARERYERLGGLADVATATSTENSLRMTLTSFVLAARLEQVAAVASEHLARMSSGRFTLVHTDQTRGGGKSGLGLEIDDSWTGVRRGTETLSGGESFFTSLALALALADVVRAEAGGHDIDTLFVDEGFGSLDEETLEQVLETLDGLRRNGRVIGVVSHVSEMKQRIDAQLVVTKTPRGSHLRVTGTALPGA